MKNAANREDHLRAGTENTGETVENQDEFSDDDGDIPDAISNRSTPENSLPTKKRRSKKKYKTLFCSSCWRDEGHIPLIKSIPVIVFLTILTLGTYLLFRTYKCRLCGNERMASGE